MYPFIQARWFTATKGRVIDLIVLHSMEAPEKGDTAENTARFFQRLPQPPPDRRASAHYCLDNDSTVQCVADRDVAYAAPGANHNGLHIELAGYARQSRAEWEDGFSDTMLRRAGVLIADKVKENGIPLRYRRASDLVRGGQDMRGITTHNEIRLAWHQTDHTDPGPGFPIDKVLNYAGAAAQTAPEAIRMAGFPRAVDSCLIPGKATTDGRPGAWVLGSDGGVFAVPEGMPFHGSMGGKSLNAPMCKIVTPGTADGYYLISEDGGIFAYGTAKPIEPYKGFGDEYRNGVHKIVGAHWVGSGLTLIASDGAAYHYEVR